MNWVTVGLFIFLGGIVLPLAGCQTTGPGPTEVKPICDALYGPLRYNSTNKESFRYAGKTLVIDLKQRNDIGRRLNCPQFN